jgi:hypothetical protein
VLPHGNSFSGAEKFSFNITGKMGILGVKSDWIIGILVAFIRKRLLVKLPANVGKLDFLRECRLYSVVVNLLF